ncbi:MoaD/ThiS family protein [Methylomonas sp. AM2-LC]|uniref:MoaD/ThiS family protein n=1 Tax=Methylomonas sp. AM2-LC TaxID=3153301 RepID=UPI003265F3C2
MSIKVSYFANLKEIVGRSGDELLAIDGALTVRQLWQQLNPSLPMPASLLVAVNMDYVLLDAAVNEGDEVAFFPPVTGG